MKTVSVTATPVSPNDTRLIMDATLYVRSANAASVTATFGSATAELFPGLTVSLGPIDISQLKLAGSVGDKVTVIGIPR